MNGNRPIGIPVTLAPKRATSDEEKLQKMMEMLLERSNNKLLGEMRAINRNLERTVTRLLENIEGVIKGDREVAIAGVVDGETDDLPRMSRIKAEATLIYSLKTGAIAKQLGLSTMRIAYLETAVSN
jgi:predicted phage gp36 major capsid-like protein